MFISCQLYKSSLVISLEGVQKGGDIPPYLTEQSCLYGL